MTDLRNSPLQASTLLCSKPHWDCLFQLWISVLQGQDDALFSAAVFPNDVRGKREQLRDTLYPPKAAEIHHHELVTTDWLPLPRMPGVQTKSFPTAPSPGFWLHTSSFCLIFTGPPPLLNSASDKRASHWPENHLGNVGRLYLKMGKNPCQLSIWQRIVIQNIERERKESRKQMTSLQSRLVI